MNPFGIPITEETLKAMPQYRDRAITQEDCAREAMRLIHAEDKNLSALQYVLDLKSSYGDGVSTMVLVYNATGAALEAVSNQKMDWLGYVYHDEPPPSFQNGQWIAFLHVHPTSQPVGCEAARVYRAQNDQGDVRDFLVAWSIPWGTTANSAYTAVREKDHFPQNWSYIKEEKLEKAGKITRDDTDQHFASAISVGGSSTSEFIAVLQHKFDPLPDEE